MKITWSDRAITDLEEIRDYIAQDSEANAVALLERIITAVEEIPPFPLRGRRVPEAGDRRTSGRSSSPATASSKVEPERTQIVTVFHGRRDLGGTKTKLWSR